MICRLISPARGGGRGPSDADAPRPANAGGVGMWLFLASLTPFFGASVIMLMWYRAQCLTWPPPGAPALPVGLWVSTGLLGGISLVLHYAARAAAGFRCRAAQRGLFLGLLLGLAFLASQAANWIALFPENAAGPGLRYAKWLTVFTGFHALHVVGGIVALGHALYRAARRAPLDRAARRARFAAMYWHYLGVVWLVLLVVILFPEHV